jgi:hypothetical protein
MSSSWCYHLEFRTTGICWPSFTGCIYFLLFLARPSVLKDRGMIKLDCHIYSSALRHLLQQHGTDNANATIRRRDGQFTHFVLHHPFPFLSLRGLNMWSLHARPSPLTFFTLNSVSEQVLPLHPALMEWTLGVLAVWSSFCPGFLKTPEGFLVSQVSHSLLSPFRCYRIIDWIICILHKFIFSMTATFHNKIIHNCILAKTVDLPAIPLLEIYPKECDSGYSKGTCTPMYLLQHYSQ